MYQRQYTYNFAPWKKDRQAAVGKYFLAAIFALLAAGAVYASLWLVAAAMAIAAALFSGSGNRLLRRAKVREYGKEIEVIAQNTAAPYLIKKGIPVRRNVLTRSCGDIDLVADLGKKSIPIEIKSFNKWNQFIFAGKREGKAYAQVERQIDALRAPFGVIWLPNGKPSLLQRIFSPRKGRVLVVLGSMASLYSVLKARS